MFCIRLYVVCIRLVRHGTNLPLFVPNIQNISQCWFIHNIIVPNKYVSGADVLNDSRNSFLCQFGSFVYIYFVKFLLIFDFLLTFEPMYVIYTCRVQPCIYGNNSSV